MKTAFWVKWKSLKIESMWSTFAQIEMQDEMYSLRFYEIFMQSEFNGKRSRVGWKTIDCV